MSLTEFNAEEVTQEFIEEGREMGRDEKAIEAAENLLKLNKLSEEEIAQTTGLSLEQVIKLKEQISVLA